MRAMPSGTVKGEFDIGLVVGAGDGAAKGNVLLLGDQE